MFNDHLPCHSTGVFVWWLFFSPHKITTTYNCSPHTSFILQIFVAFFTFRHPFSLLLFLFWFTFCSSPVELVFTFTTFFSCSLFPALLKLLPLVVITLTASDSSPCWMFFFLHFRDRFCYCSLLYDPVHQFGHLDYLLCVFCCFHMH